MKQKVTLDDAAFIQEAEIRMAALGWTTKGTRRVPGATGSSASCNERNV